MSRARAISATVFFAFLVSAELQALDPHLQIGQYVHESWTAQRGLPGEAVYQILQSKDGYLWVRTGAGLARFDGVRFVAMDAEIGNESVRAICLGADGDLLIRTESRTVIYKDGHFADYRPSAPLPGGAVRVIFESREHVVYIGSDDFIYRLEKNGSITLLRQHTGWINGFLEDHTGKIWVAGSPSIYTIERNTVTEVLDRVASPNTVSALSEDRQHRIWAITTNGLYRLHVEGQPRLEAMNPAGPNQLTCFLEDAQENFWIGTRQLGVIRIRDDGFAHGFPAFGFSAGLTDDTVLSLLEDREGNLWVGTAAGLDQLRDTKLTTFTNREGLPSSAVHSVIAMRDGSANVMTENGLAAIKDGKVTPFAHINQLASPSGQAIYESRDGSLWLGTYGGLSRIKNGKVTVYPGDGHFSKSYMTAIAEDQESLIVATDESRVFRFKDGKVLPYTVGGKTTPVTDSGIYTFTIYRDRSGTLWFGTSPGLFRIPGKVHPEGERQAGINFDVTSIFDDGRGDLWLGGRTPGVIQYRLSDGRVTRYSKQDGLFDSFVSHIEADDDGNLWISTEEGIFSASLHAMEDFADGKTKHIASVKYGLADGMKTTEASDPTSQPAGCHTPDGKLWFTTKKGIVVIDPAHLGHNLQVPPVIVESVQANGATQTMGGDLRIAPGVKSLEISYTALSLRIPERVQFKYQLQGYDREWVDAGSRRVAYYTNLPPGKYRFRVIAANDDGVWNQQGAGVNLELKPWFYQTRIFVVACIALMLLIALAVNRISTRVIRNRAEELTRMVEKRTAELVKSQRELEQLAHFDTLTSLPNRRMFTNDFGRLCELVKDGQFALLLIDCDKFKSINDTLGHDAGDAFLIEASRRLETAVRASDRVARLGGDEFAILLTGEHDEAGIGKACERIVQSFAAPVEFKGLSIAAGVSIGAAIYPQDGKDSEMLYKSADLALYEVKRRGGNGWRCYSPELREQRPLQPV